MQRKEKDVSLEHNTIKGEGILFQKKAEKSISSFVCDQLANSLQLIRVE
jgi:hypothetical protein